MTEKTQYIWCDNTHDYKQLIEAYNQLLLKKISKIEPVRH